MEECDGLARIQEEQQATVALSLVHLLQCVCKLLAVDFVGILKFQERISTVSNHVEQHVGIRVRF